jgi:hypothetical protein
MASINQRTPISQRTGSRFKIPSARQSPAVGKKTQTPGHSPKNLLFKSVHTPIKGSPMANRIQKNTPPPAFQQPCNPGSASKSAIQRTGAIIINTPAKKSKKNKSVYKINIVR